MSTGQMTPEPNGCQHCGIPLPHGWQWKPPHGWHQWVQPTDSKILARMRAHRAARALNSPKDGAR